MTPDARRAIEWDCEQVLTRFINHLDAREHDAVAALMAPDGVWHRPNGPLVGPAQVRAALAMRPEQHTIRHVISNIVVDPLSEDEAMAVTYLTVYRCEGTRVGAPMKLVGPYMVGESHNRLVRTAVGWRIKEKRTERVFERTE